MTCLKRVRDWLETGPPSDMGWECSTRSAQRRRGPVGPPRTLLLCSACPSLPFYNAPERPAVNGTGGGDQATGMFNKKSLSVNLQKTAVSK